MTTFYLSLDGEPKFDKRGNEYPRRVILDESAHGPIIGSIDAEADVFTYLAGDQLVTKVLKSAWLIAREKLDESKFFRIDGEGYFPTNSKDTQFPKLVVDIAQ